MRIILNNLRFYSYHGVLPQENAVGDWYTINLRLTLNDETALQTDNIADTVNYADVYEEVKLQMAQPSRLIEHLCGKISNRLFARFPLVTEIQISIVKQNPPMSADCDGCGIEVTMKRE